MRKREYRSVFIEKERGRGGGRVGEKGETRWRMIIIFMLSHAEDQEYFVQTRAYSREMNGSILTRFEGIKVGEHLLD